MKTTVAFPRQRRSRLLALAAACVLTAGLLQAQSPAVRIQAEVDNSQLAQIPGSQNPLAQPRNDAGRMPAATKLSGITIFFNRSATQEAALKALLQAQQTPGSPEFHQWLTPQQFGARFGMSDADLQTVEQWLEGEGFTIDSVNNARNAIHFSGTAGQVEQAFSTEMHFYNVGGQKHFAPSTALSVPAAIAPVVTNIGNLHNFLPHAMYVRDRKPMRARPAYTATDGEGDEYVFFAPGDIRLAYDVNPLLSAGNNGAGQTIAIIGQSAISTTDIENFEQAADLPVKDPVQTLVPGTGTSTVDPGCPGGSSYTCGGDEGESDIDIEWSGAMAQGATIDFVYTGGTLVDGEPEYGVFNSYQYAVDNKIGDIISLSYGECELAMTSAEFTQMESIGAQAESQGQTVMAASGDDGATACYGYTETDSGQALTTAQQEGAAVNYPASSQYVTGVGGTESSEDDSTPGDTGFSTYWENVSTTTSNVYLTSLLEHIPEIVWNDDAYDVTQGCTSENGGCLSASGGGASTLTAQPSWQTTYFSTTGEANPKSSARLVPDVAFYASPNFPGYLFCTGDESDWYPGDEENPAQTASCGETNGSYEFYDNQTGYFTVAGGTSFAAPIFAGMVADLNQAKDWANGQGLINSTLYQLAASSTTYGTAFHDVTGGSNACTSGLTDCGVSDVGFSASTGYDETTGLGSVDLNNLATAWPEGTSTQVGTTTTITPSNTAPTVNQSVSFTIAVSAASGTAVPTGSVSVSIDGGTATSYPLTAGSATATASFSYTFTTAGSYTITATYGGDTSFTTSTASTTVNVAAVSSGTGTFAMAFSPPTLSVAQGSAGTETLTITPAGGYTGTVDLTYDTSNDTALENLCVFAGTGFNSDGTSITVSNSSPVTGSISVDTDAEDCASDDAIAAMAKRGFHLISNSGKPLKTTASNKDRGSLPAGLALAGLLLAGFLGRSSRKLRGLACVIALAAIGMAMTACGNNAIGTTTTTNPPKGTYTITFDGQDEAAPTITNTAQFTLTIN